MTILILAFAMTAALMAATIMTGLSKDESKRRKVRVRK